MILSSLMTGPEIFNPGLPPVRSVGFVTGDLGLELMG